MKDDIKYTNKHCHQKLTVTLIGGNGTVLWLMLLIISQIPLSHSLTYLFHCCCVNGIFYSSISMCFKKSLDTRKQVKYKVKEKLFLMSEMRI